MQIDYKMCPNCKESHTHLDDACTSCNGRAQDQMFRVIKGDTPKIKSSAVSVVIIFSSDEEEVPVGMNPFEQDFRFHIREMQELIRDERARGDSSMEAFAKIAPLFSGDICQIVLKDTFLQSTRPSAEQVKQAKSRKRRAVA